MFSDKTIKNIQTSLLAENISGWLVYDYRNMNPFMAELIGKISNITRPYWLWIPENAPPSLLVSYVDQSRFNHLGIPTIFFLNRNDMVKKLSEFFVKGQIIAMEYSPNAEIPRVSKIDSGTLELVRSLGVEIVTSANMIQNTTQLWTTKQLESHISAGKKLTSVVQQAFNYIGENLESKATEYDISQFIQSRFADENLVLSDGPVVAANEHSSDPHFDPKPENSYVIKSGDWILIDLWSRLKTKNSMFADITWLGYVGEEIPNEYQKVFEVVIGARDVAVSYLENAFRDGNEVQGWQVDQVSRNYINKSGYGIYFNHRLGHSLGMEVHGNAVNLDSWETHDTRYLVPGIAVTIEPGIYLPDFGARSEINLYMSDQGPKVTTKKQDSVILINH